MSNNCTIRLLDEVNCVIAGLHPDHVGYFFEEYGLKAPNYFFNPKFKLGSWDGKIRYFHKTGKTYVNLLSDIIPRIAGLGYNIKLDDLRKPVNTSPAVITKDFFKDRGIVDDNGEPWIMRDYQVDLVNALLKNGGGVGLAATGAGKDQPLYSLVLTTSGWKQMGDIFPGETVITPNGKTAKVIGVFPQGKKDVYEITFHDGSTAQCGIGHLWKTKFPIKPYTAKTENRIVETKDIIEFLERKKTGKYTPGNISIPLTDPIPFASKKLLIDPYLLGVLIGDGSFQRSINVSSKDDQILHKIEENISSIGLHMVYRGGVDYTLVKKEPQNTFPPSPNILIENIKQLKLYQTKSWEKFIPNEYKEGSIEQRFELLRGLLDTDGTADPRGNVSFTTVSSQLALDVQQLVWSLGGTCTITNRTPTYTYNDKKLQGRLAYNCFIRHPHPALLFNLTRKKERCKEQHGDGRIELTRRVVSIKKVDVCNTQCIMLDDNDHLYITNDYTVTHNTSMTAALALSYEESDNIRSIIIVPDKNLTDQTREEYKYFGLDTGEYSGDNKLLDHQHVVSTWQALKNNPKI